MLSNVHVELKANVLVDIYTPNDSKMAARVDAATTHSPDNAVFCLFNKCLSESLSCSSHLSPSEYMYVQLTGPAKHLQEQ